jgi:hypothetical protein
MDGQQRGGGGSPQYSADGRWRWDGSRWVAVQQAQTATPVTSAKARMPHQRRSFWIVLGVTAVLLVGMGVCTAAVANSPSPQPGAKAALVTATPTAASTPDPTPTASPSATPAPTPTPTAAPTAAPTQAPPVAAARPPTAAPAPPPPTAVPAPPPGTPAGCYPLSNSGTCYEPGEFCRTSDHGRTGRAGNGEAIICENNNGWRWEPA